MTERARTVTWEDPRAAGMVYAVASTTHPVFDVGARSPREEEKSGLAGKLGVEIL